MNIRAVIEGYNARSSPRGPAPAGLGQLLEFMAADPKLSIIEHQAYMLATVKHETAHTFLPIKERGIKILAGRAFRQAMGRYVRCPYWPYIGRGYVQITWEDNYRYFQDRLKVPLVKEPDKALVPIIAYQILSIGMVEGRFSGPSKRKPEGGYKLEGFITTSKTDYVNARQIVNLMDRAEVIAGYAREFETILRAAA